MFVEDVDLKAQENGDRSMRSATIGPRRLRGLLTLLSGRVFGTPR